MKGESSQSQARIKRERASTFASFNDDELSFVASRPAKRTRPGPDTEIIDLSGD
jgi:hypothetical protein